jgi:hypothetical protein
MSSNNKSILVPSGYLWCSDTIRSCPACAQPARAVSARARAQSVPSPAHDRARAQSVPSPAHDRARAQSMPSPSLPKPCHRLTDQVN